MSDNKTTKAPTPPNSIPHIMLDIETLGLIPGSVILSIGAVAFRRDGHVLDRFSAYIDFHQCPHSAMMVVDLSTVRWWLQQSKEAQAELTDEKKFRVPLAEALQVLQKWIATFGPDALVWAKSPSFDCVALTAAHSITGGSGTLWHYRNERDVRTVLALAPHIELPQEDSGTHHKAEDDAEYQMRHLLAVANTLGLTLR